MPTRLVLALGVLTVVAVALVSMTLGDLRRPAPRTSPPGGEASGTATAVIGASPLPGVPDDLARLLREIRRRDAGQLAVSDEDGRFLRMLVASSGARHALEVGGASGYSTIWIGLGLRETGGHLVTIEYDRSRARELASNITQAGLADIVTVVDGDAFEEIPRVAGTFDFVFLDAWKRDYKRFFDMIFPRLDPGGLFVGHNVVNKRGELEDFLGVVTTHPSLLTTIVSPSGEGMSVSYRRRP